MLTISRATAKDWKDLKEEIKQAADSLGIDQIGFTHAASFPKLRERLQEHRQKGYESGFEESDLYKRTDPALSFDHPRSIIAIAVAYPSKLKDLPRSEPGAYRGLFSRSSWGEDYHTALRKRIDRLSLFIRERVADAETLSMVDTGALVDRAVAERAGIGWSGKNCSVITPEFGSWVYLGELLTNIPLPSDAPVLENCGDCNLCIDMCPTGALVGPGELNAQRCISYVTQTKGMVEDELKQKMGNRLYGCDTCQVVCPINKGLNWTQHDDLQPDPETVKPLLQPLLTMSNREFREQFGSSAASWRGKKPLQRNAVIALGNFRDTSAVPLLIELLESDPRPVLRGTAAWALSKIGGEAACRAVEKARQHENDEAALSEIESAYTRLSNSTSTAQEKEWNEALNVDGS